MNQTENTQQELDIILPQKITMRNTFPFEFFSKTKFPARECVYIDEIDDDSITIYAKTEMQEETNADIKIFYNNESCECSVSVSSKEVMPGGLKKYLLEYTDVSPEAGIIITAIAGGYAVKHKTKTKNTYPCRQFNVQIYDEEYDEWQAHFMGLESISEKGMEYKYNGLLAIDRDEEFIIKITPKPGISPVTMAGRFICEHMSEESSGREGWIKFTCIPDESLEVLSSWLMESVQGEPGGEAAPICGFE